MKYLIILSLLSFSAHSSDIIGSVKAKGLFIKDRIEITAFDDPTISGVSCYTTRYIRTASFSDDSTNSSLACRRVGQIKGNLTDFNNVFSQDKSFLSINKETVVDRFWDAKRRVLVYLSYTKSWGNKNSSHSISVVPVDL